MVPLKIVAPSISISVKIREVPIAPLKVLFAPLICNTPSVVSLPLIVPAIVAVAVVDILKYPHLKQLQLP